MIARTPKWMVIVVALTGSASWRRGRRVGSDLDRWHRATERLDSMCDAGPTADGDDCATLWCKVLPDETATTQSYDRARDPSNS